MHRATESDVGQELDEVEPAHRSLVDEVLAFAAAHEAARDRDLAVVDLVAEAAVGIVEDELDLAVVRRGMGRGAAEQHVVRLLCPHLRRRQRTGGPDDRIGDVRLARAVRSHDDGNPRLELQLKRVHERLEATNLDRLQVHVKPTLTKPSDRSEGNLKAGSVGDVQ